jgi:hypothetical protein
VGSRHEFRSGDWTARGEDDWKPVISY